MNSPANTFEEGKSSATPKRNRTQTVVVAIALLLATLPLLHSFAKREIARWYHAAAFELRLQDKDEAALAKLEEAIAWNPRDVYLVMQRASWKMRRDSIQSALDDCELALDLARRAYGSRQTARTRAVFANALNQHAYGHALAEKDLEQALKDVEQALRMTGDNYNLLDTRGYIHLKLGNLAEAQRDLEAATDGFEGTYKRQLARIRQQRTTVTDERPIDNDIRTLQETLAVFVHHRGEIYDALEREEDAIRDLRRAKRLGYDPTKGVW